MSEPVATPNPIRVAQIGAGYFAQFHAEAWIRHPDVELVAIADRDLAKARRLAEQIGQSELPLFADGEEMVAQLDVDIVDIATPPSTHFDLISRAVGRRQNIICQKPFCTSLKEAKAVVDAAQSAGVMLAVHENFRFQPWYRKVRTLLDERVLGQVYQTTFRLRPGDGQGEQAYLDRQPYFQAMERFLVHETAIHWIDTFRYLRGDIEAVFADLRRLNPAIAGEDAGFILFRFVNGERGVFDGNRLSDHVAENRRLTMGEFMIEGEKGVLTLDGNGYLHHRKHDSNIWEEVPLSVDRTRFGGDCVYAMQSHIINYLKGGGRLETDGKDYLKNLFLEEAIYRSHELGAWVKLHNGHSCR